MQVADEPEQYSGGEEVEDHSGLECRVVVVDPGQRFGGGRVHSWLLGVDEAGEGSQRNEGQAARAPMRSNVRFLIRAPFSVLVRADETGTI